MRPLQPSSPSSPSGFFFVILSLSLSSAATFPPLSLFLIPIRVSLSQTATFAFTVSNFFLPQSIMSEPTTTAAVPKPEDKPTEVTPAVEPSTETPAPVPVRRPTVYLWRLSYSNYPLSFFRTRPKKTSRLKSLPRPRCVYRSFARRFTLFTCHFLVQTPAVTDQTAEPSATEATPAGEPAKEDAKEGDKSASRHPI